MCNCQKQVTFTPRQFQLEENGFKKFYQKNVRGTESVLNKFLKPAVNVAAPFIGMAVGAKSKTSEVAEAATNILKCMSGGKLLPLIDMNGGSLRFKGI